MSPSLWRYGLAALVVAWVIDALFWETPAGVSFFLWTLVAVAAGFALAALEKVQPSRWTYLVAAASLVLAAFSFLRSEPFTLFLSFSLSLASLMLLAATFRSGNWVAYRLWDYVPAFVNLFIAALIRPIEIFRTIKPAETYSNAAAPAAWHGAGKNIRPVLVGLLLALPVMAVFGSLLSSADPIFANQLAGFLKLFDLSRLGQTIFRLFYILVLAYIFSGVYLHALRPAKIEARPGANQTLLKPFLGWIEAGIVLTLIDLMFALFVAIQFWYFFGGQANITSSGFTYADYARRGFFELVAVALLSLVVYLVLATVTRRENTWQRRTFTSLSVFLMAMVLVMLVSAFQRLLLYESAYGYTQLRMVTHIFMIWLGLLLAAVVIFELLQRRQHFGLVLLLTILGFGLTAGFFNIESTIVQQNVQRARLGSELDQAYISNLGDDAVPALVTEFRRADQPQAIRDSLGADLACRTYRLAETPAPAAWQSFNLSRYTASSLLTQAQGELSAYKVAATDSGLFVTIQGKPQSCDLRLTMD
jgi:hypothetical protein